MSRVHTIEKVAGGLDAHGNEYYFNHYVSRNDELTFDSPAGILLTEEEQEQFKTAFDGARKHYHTADTYISTVNDLLDKYEIM